MNALRMAELKRRLHKSSLLREFEERSSLNCKFKFRIDPVSVVFYYSFEVLYIFRPRITCASIFVPKAAGPSQPAGSAHEEHAALGIHDLSRLIVTKELYNTPIESNYDRCDQTSPVRHLANGIVCPQRLVHISYTPPHMSSESRAHQDQELRGRECVCSQSCCDSH